MKKFELVFTAILPIFDFLMIFLGAFIAYFLRFWSPFTDIRPIIFNLAFNDYLYVAIPACLGAIIISAFSGLYKVGIFKKKAIDEAFLIFNSISVTMMLISVFIFMVRELFVSRFIVLAAWILAIILMIWGRLILRALRRYFFKRGVGINNAIIVGEGKAINIFTEEIENNPSFGYKIIAKIKSQKNILNELSKLNEKDNVDEVIFSRLNYSEDIVLEVLDFCNVNHIGFKYLPALLENYAKNNQMETVLGVPVIEVRRTPLDGWGKIVKRIFDVIGSVFAIIIFLPIMIFTAIAIKIDSPGNIFFSYKRIGQFGKSFTYFKFRSMISGSHRLRYDKDFRKKVSDLRGWNNKNPMVKYKNDPRITKVGHIIRKYSIDELPELFNVFIGRMSLVGPRPHEPEEVKKYQKHHKKVLAIKPGITGMSQISGRSDLDFDEEVQLDIYYIENWSLKLDISILIKTPFALFSKRKAE